jgi:hypothetical protein
MCGLCCREFRGWCKSFTQTEVLLSIFEAVLLMLLLSFLTFVIIHLIVCPNGRVLSLPDSTTTLGDHGGLSTYTLYPSYTPPIEHTTSFQQNNTNISSPDATTGTTLSPGIQCSWSPSIKTEATTHYYEFVNTVIPSDSHETTAAVNVSIIPQKSTGDAAGDEDSDGEEPEPYYNSFTLALVKSVPLRDMMFGCILTIVSEHWTLTAASCIESIEEVDSLDSFVILESHGELTEGVTHAVTDIQIHPDYQGGNRTRDLAALKSDDSLIKRGGAPVALPQPVDHFLITPGETFTILGYGPFRYHRKLFYIYYSINTFLVISVVQYTPRLIVNFLG